MYFYEPKKIVYYDFRKKSTRFNRSFMAGKVDTREQASKNFQFPLCNYGTLQNGVLTHTKSIHASFKHLTIDTLQIDKKETKRSIPIFLQ